MSSSRSNIASTAQSSRSSVQLDGKTKSTMDQRELQLLEDHQPWEMLDNTVLAIIDQTYAALLEILGLAAPPAGGGPVKARQLVDATGDDPDSPASPMLCVVEASARHCCVRLIDGFDDGGGIRAWWGPDLMRYISFSQRRRQKQKRRTSVSTSSGTVHLARVDGGEGEAGQGDHVHGWKSTDNDDDRPDVSEKGLVGVLDRMRSHLDNAMQLENIVLRMASRNGRYDKLMESFTVRMALQRMRREVDLGAVMRRCRDPRQHRRARVIVGRRRPADEMDVDQVDEGEVLIKRLKAMHV